jgi:hypothetical protein
LLQKWDFAKGLLTITIQKEGIFAANALFCKKNAAKLECALIFLVISHSQTSNTNANE